MSWILIIIFVLAVVAALVGLFVVWFNRKTAALIGSMDRDIALTNERAVFGPVKGLYRGTNRNAFEITGNCVAALTSRRFIYETITGRREEIPLEDISPVSENPWFAGQYRNGRQHLILELRDGRKVGFILHNHSEMLIAMRSALAACNRSNAT